jgi:hypothetical protein
MELEDCVILLSLESLVQTQAETPVATVAGS